MPHRLIMLAALIGLISFTGACGAFTAGYDETVSKAKEEVLREDLRVMREMIKAYAHDKGALPQSLEDLVRAGYLHSIPEDPMSGKPDWMVTAGEDPKLGKGSKGMIDVHSSSSIKSAGGTPYSEW